MSSRYFKIPIHVKPYVKKYIAANYGDVILISLKDPASMVLYSFLQKQNIPFREDPKLMGIRYSELTESFMLMLQRRDQYKHGLYIHQNNQLLINNYFEEEIFNRIFQQCSAYSKAKLPLTAAIEDFCDEFNIEIDIDLSMEAVLKAEYRYRLAKKNLKKDRAILSTCEL